MNLKQIGRQFEKEAYEILKKEFDKVEWLSETKQSTFDFKCFKDGEIYYGDAKLISNRKINPRLKYSQKNADFIILKRAGKINIIWKENFPNNVHIQKEEETSMQIKKETWVRLNSRKAYPSQTFDTIINNLMDYEKSNILLNKKGGK